MALQSLFLWSALLSSVPWLQVQCDQQLPHAPAFRLLHHERLHLQTIRLKGNDSGRAKSPTGSGTTPSVICTWRDHLYSRARWCCGFPCCWKQEEKTFSRDRQDTQSPVWSSACNGSKAGLEFTILLLLLPKSRQDRLGPWFPGWCADSLRGYRSGPSPTWCPVWPTELIYRVNFSPLLSRNSWAFLKNCIHHKITWTQGLGNFFGHIYQVCVCAEIKVAFRCSVLC